VAEDRKATRRQIGEAAEWSLSEVAASRPPRPAAPEAWSVSVSSEGEEVDGLSDRVTERRIGRRRGVVGRV
jgi:hypothetical protein